MKTTKKQKACALLMIFLTMIMPCEAADNDIIFSHEVSGNLVPIRLAASNGTVIGWTSGSPANITLATVATTGSASDLGAGTLPDARFPGTLPALSGANLTALTAANLSGAVAVANGGTGATSAANARNNLGASTGVWPATLGGTGLSAYTSGGIPYANSTTSLLSSGALTLHGVVIGGGAGGAPVSTAAGTIGYPLVSNGSSSDPTFQQVDYTGIANLAILPVHLSVGAVDLSTTKVTGTNPLTKGGTGATTAIGALDSLITAEANVTSATTTDLGAASTRNVNITGTTTITGFGTVTAGVMRWGRFAGSLTLTHNATSLILPGGANITTAANDRFAAVSLGSGNWLVYVYQKADGTAIVGGAGGGDFSSNTSTSVDSEILLFSGTAGKTGKRATGTGIAKVTSGVLGTETISTPLAESGGTLSIANAAADGSTKGAASFAAADFNATSGNITLDYTNGQAATGSVPGFLSAADWTTFNAKAPTAAPTFSGILTFGTGAKIISPSAMGALSIDVSKSRNTKSISADSTVTFSGTPTTDTVFGVRIKNTDSVSHTVTWPSSFSMDRQVTAAHITTVPASGRIDVQIVYDGTDYTLFGDALTINDLTAAAVDITADYLQFYDATDGLQKKVLFNATGLISDTAEASSWNGVTTIGPSKNAVYDYVHQFDTDDDGKVDVIDQVAGVANTNSSGVLQTPITTYAGLLAVISDMNSATRTATNQRTTARITSISSSATPTVNTDNCDCVTITALAADITSMTTNLSGTPVNFDQLEFRIVGTAARAITWGASFVAGPTALPTTTVTTKALHVYFEWDSVQSKWVCMSSGSDA